MVMVMVPIQSYIRTNSIKTNNQTRMATTTTRPLSWPDMADSTTGWHSSVAGRMPVTPLRSSASPSSCPRQVWPTKSTFFLTPTQICRMRLGADARQKRMAVCYSLCWNDDRLPTWLIVHFHERFASWDVTVTCNLPVLGGYIWGSLADSSMGRRVVLINAM